MENISDQAKIFRSKNVLFRIFNHKLFINASEFYLRKDEKRCQNFFFTPLIYIQRKLWIAHYS